jgi:hypothetical protein
MTIEAALGAEMEHHLGYAKHELCPFSIIIGSKLLLRSLGTNISTSP